MLNYIRSIIAGLLISMGAFVSPVKHIAPTPKPIIGITITPKVTSTIIPTPTIIVQPQVQKCQFNKEQMTALMKQYGYSDEDIKTFFKMRPGDCFNVNPKNQNAGQNIESTLNNIEQQQRKIEQKLQDSTDCQKKMSNYSDCLNRESQESTQYQECVNANLKNLQDYQSCITSSFNKYCYKGIDRYCSKPSTGFCFKPFCSY